ncbi:MAG TPA: hypothetical protein VFJ52_08265, partial [Terriglobia bacterium]|nr:hypothetical protein [Terriglobia bacterium]
DRFPAAESEALKASLLAAGMPLTRLLDDERFRELRQMYEPYVNGLAGQFFMPLPPWSASQQLADNWQRSAWNRIPRSVRRLQPSAIIKGEDSE